MSFDIHGAVAALEQLQADLQGYGHKLTWTLYENAVEGDRAAFMSPAASKLSHLARVDEALRQLEDGHEIIVGESRRRVVTSGMLYEVAEAYGLQHRLLKHRLVHRGWKPARRRVNGSHNPLRVLEREIDPLG